LSAISLFQEAIKLDPNFAIAYLALGDSYWNVGELELASDNLQKAYELRERVSEIERLTIEAEYYDTGIGDLQKAQRAMEVFVRIYPRDAGMHNNLGVDYEILGQYDKAVAEYREAVRLNLTPISYGSLARCYIKLNRPKESEGHNREAQAKKIDAIGLHFDLYPLAFLQNDATGMTQQADWAAGKPGAEDRLLYLEADTAAYFGRLRKSREFSRQAVASAERAEEKERTASYEADTAVREALFGNAAEARQWAKSALVPSMGVRAQYSAALTMALIGNAARAQALADDLAQRFPSDTVVQFMYLPTLHAQLALTRNDPSKAIDLLSIE